MLHSSSGKFIIRQGDWVLIDARTGDDNGGPQRAGEPLWLKQDRGYATNSFSGEIYNMRDDPAQRRNLYGEKPEVVERLKTLLERYKAEGRSVPLPVIADESCLVEGDVPRCAGHFHGINIKLTKAGGLTPARRMIRRARELGLKVMVGCMAESTVGISAIAQLLPLLDYVDMDGATLIAKDVASGVRVEKGRAVFPSENGNGVRLLEVAG